MIKENLQEVERRICEACKRSGRDRSEVQLIAVSKTKPVSMTKRPMRKEFADLEKTSRRSCVTNTKKWKKISNGI